MAMQNKVRLTICGTEYALTTDEPEGYIQELGAQMDTSMRNLMAANDRVTVLMAAVLTGILKADEAKKAVETADRLRSQMKEYFDSNARAQREADAVRRENDRLQKEMTELRRQKAIVSTEYHRDTP